MNRLCAVLCALLASAPFARAADIISYRASGRYGAVSYEALVIWGQGEYLLDLWAQLSAESQSLAKNRQAAEVALEKRLEAVFLQSVVSLPLNSRETAGSRLKANPGIMSGLKRLMGAAVKRQSRLSEQMEDLRLRYAFPLYGEGGLLSVFAPGGQASSLERYLGFVPAAVYTGLVIYVQGSYPAWGREGVETTLKPALLPRIYDTDMNQVLDATQADRQRLLGWGLVAYSNDLDEIPFEGRIGTNPLRTVARGVYGVGDTDIVISREMAERLLAREENMRMLREGRILVILDAQTAPSPPPKEADTSEAEIEEIGPAGSSRTAAPKTAAPAARE